MALDPVSQKNWEEYITKLFKENPELEQDCGQIKDALVHFSQNHTPEQFERFVDAWGKFDTHSLEKILNVPEHDLQKFFGILLKRLS